MSGPPIPVYVCRFIRRAEIARQAVERRLLKQKTCEVVAEHVITGEGAEQEVAVLRLNISCPRDPESWSISLKLHATRFDCIDWESRYRGLDGCTYNGWHRHNWDRERNTAEGRKVPLDGFDGIQTVRSFLVRALKEMGVVLNAHDDGDSGLDFN